MSANTRLPVLLLPGLLNDARLYQAQIDGLHSIADCSVADISQFDSISELAASALQQAPTERFALIGLSMGGYVALEIMRQAPRRVIGLALLDTSARPDTAEATENRRKAMRQADTDFDGVIAALMPKLLHADRWQNHRVTGVITAMGQTLGKDAFKRQQTAIIGRIDSRPHLTAIQCPTLVLCGHDDVITPMEVHREMADGIGGATLQVIERCGHLSTLDQPEKVTQALRDWLQSITPGAQPSP